MSSIKIRSSNIELLRIVAMFSIFTGHCFNSCEGCYDYQSFDWKVVFMQWASMWGKTAINSFVVISGYFMCTSQLTAKRYLKILLEVIFYNFAIYAIFLIAGRETCSPKRLFELFGFLFRNANAGFLVSFLWFYLGIPFYNVLIKNLDRRELYKLIGLLLMAFTFNSTFFANKYMFHHVFWYMTIYFIGAAIRLHPMKWMSNQRFCVASLVGMMLFCYCWAPVNDMLLANKLLPVNFEYWFVRDSDKILALGVGIVAFIVFRNWNMGYHRWINTVASTTFGILLIHTNGDAMRQWLFVDFLQLPQHWGLPMGQFVAYNVSIWILLFCTLSAIDYLRIRFIERPLFNCLFKGKQ